MKFEEIIDQYLDIDEINKKIKQDCYDEMNNNQSTIQNKTKRKKFVETITIREFVSLLGTNHDCNGLKHKGLKSFNNPYIVGLSNDFALKNPEYVIKRSILVVIDDYGNPGTYINPVVLKNIETMEQYKHTLELLKKVSIHNLASINKLYTEYSKIIKKISELQDNYILNIDFLNNFELKHLLRKIKNYTKEATDKCIEFTESQDDMNQIMEVQKEIFNNFNTSIELKEEEIDLIEEYDDYDIDCKINRQKTFIQRNKRGIRRKERL